jgi:hypothetical protein
MVQHLLSKNKVLSSNLSSAREREKERKEGGRQTST